METQTQTPNRALTPAAAPQRRWPRVLLCVALMGLVAGASAGAARYLRGRRAGPPPADPGPAAGEADLVKRGQLVYGVYCAACHGAEGHGDGPSAAQLRPPPRDFAAGPLKCGNDRAAVRRVIADGVHGTPMPGLGAALSSADLDALAAYVLTLAAPGDVPPPLPPEMRALLTQAGFTPADPARPAPPLELRDGDGRPLALADLRGRWVLIQFWETRCVPCLAKLPHLERLADEYRERGLAVLAVCLDEADAGRLRAVGRLPLYADPRGLARARYDVSALPAACLVDPEGRLIGRGPGPPDWAAEPMRALLDACRPSRTDPE
jgi:mono/diheme cytochrome c family protein